MTNLIKQLLPCRIFCLTNGPRSRNWYEGFCKVFFVFLESQKHLYPVAFDPNWIQPVDLQNQIKIMPVSNWSASFFLRWCICFCKLLDNWKLCSLFGNVLILKLGQTKSNRWSKHLEKWKFTGHITITRKSKNCTEPPSNNCLSAIGCN